MSNGNGSILPSFDRANSETAAGFFAELKRIWDVADETCIPAIVEEYNAETHIAKVSPLPVRVFDTLNGEVEKARESVEIPVMHYAHGGFVIEAPLFKGDTGYIIAANRNCESIRSKNDSVLAKDAKDEDIKEAHDRADTFATKQYAWGVFVPCSWAKCDKPDRSVISITDVRTGDKLIFGNGGLWYVGKAAGDKELITDIRYDYATHQIQKKSIAAKFFGDFIVKTGDESGWKMVEGGQAVVHNYD